MGDSKIKVTCSLLKDWSLLGMSSNHDSDDYDNRDYTAQDISIRFHKLRFDLNYTSVSKKRGFMACYLLAIRRRLLGRRFVVVLQLIAETLERRRP